MEEVFEIRRRIARLGSSDRMAWWDSKALTPAGLYALGQLFRRTAYLTAADLAIRAARLRHDRAVPREPLVHLFNFGEAFEGSFERWLIDRKAEMWDAPPLLDEPEDAVEGSAATALSDVKSDQPKAREDRAQQNGCVVVGTISPGAIEAEDGVLDAARRLAPAYSPAVRGNLMIPYFRLAR